MPLDGGTKAGTRVMTPGSTLSLPCPLAFPLLSPRAKLRLAEAVMARTTDAAVDTRRSDWLNMGISLLELGSTDRPGHESLGSDRSWSCWLVVLRMAMN